MINFLNFDGSATGSLPAGLANTTTVTGQTGNYQVGTTGSISSPGSLHDASGQTGGSALWTGLLAADEAIQFDQVVNLSAGLINPLIRMSANGQTGYGAFVSWSTPKIDFVAIGSGGITTIASPTIPSYSNGTQVTVKLEVQGPNLRFKSWPVGTTEPTSWTATTTDTTYSQAGYPGFSSAGGSGGAADNVYFGPAGTTFHGGFLPPLLSTGTLTSSSAQFNWTSATQSAGSPTYQLFRSPHGANAYVAIPGAVLSPSRDANVAVSTTYDYKVTASDGINAPVSSNVLTVTIPSPSPATNYTLTGPISGITGQISSPFTVTPNGPYTGTITLTPSGCGLSTPILLNFTNSASPQSFTLTPLSSGTVTLSLSNSGSLGNPPSTTYLVSTTATFYTLTGPSASLKGQNSLPFLVTPNGPYTGTITLTPSGCGLSTPIILTFASSSTPQSFMISPSIAGTVTITATNSGGLPDANPVTCAIVVTSSALPASGQGIELTFDSNLAGVTAPDEVQSLSLTSAPAGGGFSLAFGAQTTSSITGTLTLPDRYLLWTATGLTPGVSYTIAINTTSDAYHANVRVDLIDGINGSVPGPILATNDCGESSPGAVVFSEIPAGSTTAEDFKIIGTVTPSGSTLLVLITQMVAVAPRSLSAVYVDCCRIKNNSTSAITYLGTLDHPPTLSVSAQVAIHDAVYPGNIYQGQALAARFGYNPDGQTLSVGGPALVCLASEIQAALTGLSSVGGGNLTVADTSGVNTGPWNITFQNALGRASQPLLTSSSPSVLVTHTNVGGKLVTVSRNGVSVGSADDLVWGQGQFGGTQQPAYSPVLQAFFRQPATTQVRGYGDGLFASTGYDWGLNVASGASGHAMLSTFAGSTATFIFSGLPSDTYQIALTWPTDPTLGASIPITVVDQNGTPLASDTLNQSVPPSGLTDSGVTYHVLGTVTITYPIHEFRVTFTNPGVKMVVDLIHVARTSTTTGVQFSPTDTVTVSWPDGLFTTANGAVAGVSNLTATNLVNQPDFTPPAAPVTLQVGYNLEPDYYYSPGFVYSNLAQRISFLDSGHVVTMDANGYPLTATVAAFADQTIGGSSPVYPFANHKGPLVLGGGLYTLKWDGTSVCKLNNLANDLFSEVMEYQSITGTTNNVRVYSIQPTVDSNSIHLYFEVDSSGVVDGNGHYPYSLSNLQIYRPDPSDPTGMTPQGITSTPPKYDPTLDYKLAGAKILRFMDWLTINNNCHNTFADFRVAGSLTDSIPAKTATVNLVASVPGTPFWYPDRYPSIRLTTTTPHPYVDANVVTFSPAQTMSFSNGATYPAGSSVAGVIKVIDASTIDLVVGYSTMTLTTTPTSGTLSMVPGFNQGVLTDLFEICNRYNCHCHLNIPFTLNDAGVTQLVQTAATGPYALNAGLKLYIEFSNEHWNSAFNANAYLTCLQGSISGSETYAPTTQYVIKAVHVNALALAVWLGSGRSRSDIVLGMGSWANGVGTTTAIATESQTLSSPPDIIYTAPYYNNQPVNGTEVNFPEFYDLATVEQSLDYLKWVTTWGGDSNLYVAQHRAALDAAGLTSTRIGCYEGGMQALIPGQSLANAFVRSYGMLTHPRMRWIMIEKLRQLEVGGASILSIFYVFGAGLTIDEGGIDRSFPEVWSTYWYSNQQDGTGYWTTDATNISNPLDFASVKSQVGGAVKGWNALLMVAPVVSGHPTLIGNGSLRTIGAKPFGGK